MKYSIRYIVSKLVRSAGVKFDPDECPEIVAMRKEIAGLSGGSIQFVISREANGNWMAEAVNLPGIITGGTAKDDVNTMIKDAVFTYFGVPAKYCDERLIREASEPVTLRQEIYATA